MADFNQLTMTRHGPMVANVNDKYVGTSILEYGEFSPGEARLFQQILTPDMLVIEVGANMGALTVPIARCVKHVIALEPQRHPFYLLCANVALNSLDNVTCLNKAAGQVREILYFPNIKPDVACNFGGGEPTSPSQTSYPVECMVLDNFKSEPVAFIKIDVEGQELKVLQGARLLIMAQRPILFVENDREEKSAQLVSYIRSLKYDLFWHKPPLYEPGNYRGSTVDLWPGIGSFNMLCIPKERHITPDLRPVE